MDEKKPMIFIPSDNDKKLAKEVTNRIIDLLAGQRLEFKAFVMQMLLESIEETYNIDIRNGISIQDK